MRSNTTGSALQTAPDSSQGRRDAAHSSLSLTLPFFSFLDAVDNESISSLEQRVGEPWGAPAPQLPQEGAAAASQPEVSWHTLGAPECAAGQYIKRVKKNPTISQEAAQDTAGKKPDLDHFLA